MWAIAACAVAAGVMGSVRPMPNGRYVDPASPTSGDCKGCGAPWEIRPLDTHAASVLELIDRYNRCSYCKRPFKS